MKANAIVYTSPRVRRNLDKGAVYDQVGRLAASSSALALFLVLIGLGVVQRHWRETATPDLKQTWWRS